MEKNIFTIIAQRKIHITNVRKMFLQEKKKISSQIKSELQKVSLPDDCADWMINELKKEKLSHANHQTFLCKS